MGELPFFRAHAALHPDHLWIWETSVYVDENQRTWLPVTIELYPGRRYRGSDSSFWRIVYHIELSGMEDMLLEQLPDLEDE